MTSVRTVEDSSPVPFFKFLVLDFTGTPDQHDYESDENAKKEN